MYDSLAYPNAILQLQNWYYSYPQNIQNSFMKLGLEVSSIKVEYLGLQKDNNSCGHWAQSTAVALTNITKNLSLEGLKSYITDTRNVTSEEIYQLRIIYNETFSQTKEHLRKNFNTLLQRIKNNPNYLKDILNLRGDVYYSGDIITESSSVKIQELIDELNKENSDLIFIKEKERFLPEKIYKGIKSGLLTSQKIIFDALIFGASSSVHYCNLFSHFEIFSSEDRAEYVEQYAIRLPALIKQQALNFWVEEINKLLNDYPDIFRNDLSVTKDIEDIDDDFELPQSRSSSPDTWVAQTASPTVALPSENSSLSDNPKASESKSTSFELFKASVKIMLAIAVIALILIAAIAIASNPGLGIGLLVGVGAAVAVYATCRMFKCCSGDTESKNPSPTPAVTCQ